jgi:hypothetical protein
MISLRLGVTIYDHQSTLQIITRTSGEDVQLLSQSGAPTSLQAHQHVISICLGDRFPVLWLWYTMAG